ncbi:GNAT family N-acetyltransferase [Exiguobacterium sp. Helios]|uniref:GNAT family N-acetyltransferase n=1 Tax=Exiguobacterium sp. Helios TaxID=2735868 RepID=UPI00165DEEC3|nr:GNAT family N-acetyltransferase [Exiguobacterium sp. Helios]QNR21105.1 GNAT family N-acetyltransferase [Exiguobacterium sp. Helios]
MKIQLKACTALDAEELYVFELENRLYFEQSIPSRGEDYYLPEIFKQRHASLLQEQRDGTSFFYLIKDEGGEIMGRINLVNRDVTTKRAELGYRIGQNHTGKGIAKEAVRLLIGQCRKLDIKEIQAKTTDGNIASRKILTGNGFQQESKAVEVELNGQRMMLIQFKRTMLD